MNKVVFLKVCFSFLLLCELACSVEWKGEDKSAFPWRSKPIRLILSDVDGTLVNGSDELSDLNAVGIRLAHILGIQLAFATGRPMCSTLKALGEAKLKKLGVSGSPGVYLNGSYVVGPNGDVVRDAPLEPEILRKVLSVCEEEGVLATVTGVTSCTLVKYDGARDELPQVHKLHIEGVPTVISKLRTRLGREFGSKLAFTQSHGRAFQVHPAGTNKGIGFALLVKALRIMPSEVLAMGNAENDLSMFALAGTSVAVEDGYEVARAAANYITVKSTEGALLDVVMKILQQRVYPVAPLTSIHEQLTRGPLHAEPSETAESA